MRPESMRTAFLILFALLTALFVMIAWPFMKAAFLAFTLAVIFFPVQRFARERCRMPRYLAALVTTTAVGICVLIPLAVLMGVVITQLGDFVGGISSQVQDGTLSGAVHKLFVSIHDWIERLWGQAPSVEELQTSLMGGIQEIAGKFYEFSPRVLSTTMSIVANFVLMLVFLVVFLAEGGGLYHWIMETTPLAVEHRSELARDVRVTITSSIAAAVVIALVQGTLLGLGFWRAGFEQPSSWGLVAMILSLIPIVGASSCYLVATSLLFASGNVKAALFFLSFGVIIVSGVDNILRPLIIRGQSRMHPVLLFVVIVGAVKIMGPIGLLVGPMLLSIFLASLRIYRREFVQVG